jgi:hypothetical protein
VGLGRRFGWDHKSRDINREEWPKEIGSETPLNLPNPIARPIRPDRSRPSSTRTGAATFCTIERGVVFIKTLTKKDFV